MRGPRREYDHHEQFIYTNSFEKPKACSMVRMALESNSFRSSTITDIMVDTFKFTNEGKVWNSFCVGCFIKEMPRTLVLTFTQDEQRAKCGESCCRSLMTHFDCQLLHKN